VKINGHKERRKVPSTELTWSRLLEVINYNPKTGVFIWKKYHSGIRIGKEAGALLNNKYRRISIDGFSYLSHRLAWMYVHKEFPKCDIDHINGNGLDNRIVNLRLATRSQNLIHSERWGPSRGIYFNKNKKKWHARIHVNGRVISLGYHRLKKNALISYQESATIYHGKFNSLTT